MGLPLVKETKEKELASMNFLYMNSRQGVSFLFTFKDYTRKIKD